jgi:hypothetical protein
MDIINVLVSIVTVAAALWLVAAYQAAVAPLKDSYRRRRQSAKSVS